MEEMNILHVVTIGAILINLVFSTFWEFLTRMKREKVEQSENDKERSYEIWHNLNVTVNGLRLTTFLLIVALMSLVGSLFII